MTDTAPPEPFVWDGEVFRPLRPKRADAFYTVGERYLLAPVSQRSDATHKHEFAWLRNAWLTLPDHLAERFPSVEHLRKFALIKAGYCDSHTMTCSSKAEALRLAAYIRPIDEFAIVTVEGATVARYTAKSQSRRAMGAKVFQESKTAILDIISEMLGVQSKELAEAQAA